MLATMLAATIAQAADLRPPDGLADLQITTGDHPVSVTLTLSRAWHGKGLSERSAQLDPITTILTPRVERREGSDTWWFTGYHLSEHEEPGDTLITYVLLLERRGDGSIQGFWYEDHEEVPRQLWSAEGTLQGRALALSLSGEGPGRITGLVQLP